MRLIQRVVDAARAANLPVSVCGEMAGYPLLVPLLIGLGIRHLSASAPLVPLVKHLVRKMELPAAAALAEEALSLKSGAEVKEACRRLMRRIAPEMETPY